MYAQADKLSQEITALKNRKKTILQDYSGQAPSHQIEIPLQSQENDDHGLNVIAMLERALSLHQEKKYCFTGLNCSSSCRKILESGLSDKHLASSLTIPFIDTPESVKRFGLYLTQYFKKNNSLSNYGSIEYYSDLLQNNLEFMPEHCRLKPIVEEIDLLLAKIKDLKNEGKINPKEAAKLSKDLYDLSVNPSGKIDSFINDYTKESKVTGIIDNVISFVLYPFNKGKLKNNSELLESIQGIINDTVEVEKQLKWEQLSQKKEPLEMPPLPPIPIQKTEAVEPDNCINKCLRYKEQRKRMILDEDNLEHNEQDYSPGKNQSI